MATTDAEKLVAVEAAIDRCLDAQEWQTASGRRMLNAQLSQLTKREESLIARIAGATNSGSMASVGQIRRPA